MGVGGGAPPPPPPGGPPPAPGVDDVLVQERPGLVTGVQDVKTTTANLGEQYDEGPAEFR